LSSFTLNERGPIVNQCIFPSGVFDFDVCTQETIDLNSRKPAILQSDEILPGHVLQSDQHFSTQSLARKALHILAIDIYRYNFLEFIKSLFLCIKSKQNHRIFFMAMELSCAESIQ
jgi:hypothetical protein